VRADSALGHRGGALSLQAAHTGDDAGNKIGLLEIPPAPD